MSSCVAFSAIADSSGTNRLSPKSVSATGLHNAQLTVSRSNDLPSSGDASTTETETTPGFLPAAIDQRCEQQIETVEVRALRARASRLLNSKSVSEPDAWCRAVAKALCATDMPLTPEHFALILAFIEKESSFVAHGLLPEQPHPLKKIAYRVIDDVFRENTQSFERIFGKGGTAKVVSVILDLLKKIEVFSSDIAKRKFDEYYEKYEWNRVRTEWDVENQVVDDVFRIADSPTPVGLLLRTLFDLKPRIQEPLRRRSLFRTVGPLQVPVGDALRIASEDGLTYDKAQIRHILYSIRGGVYFGVRRLQSIAEIYLSHSELNAKVAGFIAIDYTAFRYLARNSALIKQFSRLSGMRIPIHTDLFTKKVENALLPLAAAMLATSDSSQNTVSPIDIVKKFRRESLGLDIEQNALYAYIKAQYQSQFNEKPGYAAIPNKCTRSYKGGDICLSGVAHSVSEKFDGYCAAIGCR
jgi:hypothetical protein